MSSPPEAAAEAALEEEPQPERQEEQDQEQGLQQQKEEEALAEVTSPTATSPSRRLEDACRLSALVFPPHGPPASAQEIWDHVIKTGARLPSAPSCSLSQAVEAVRAGEPALAAYHAAGCFQVGSAAALAAPDSKAREFLWLNAVNPIVAEVPLGSEKLLVRPDGDGESEEWISTAKLDGRLMLDGKVMINGRGLGTLAKGLQGSASTFRAGEILEATPLEKPKRPSSRGPHPSPGHRSGPKQDKRNGAQPMLGGSLSLRRFHLGNAELRAIMPMVIDGAIAGAHEYLAGITAKFTFGGRYHIVAYPLAGDLQKALLRPGHRRPVVESEVFWKLGETLMSQCAKSGQWDLLVVLLQAGVPVPDLSKEFQDLCGSTSGPRRRWVQDLPAPEQRPGSFLELAALQHGKASSSSASPVALFLEAYRDRLTGSPDLRLSDCRFKGQRFLEGLIKWQRWELLGILLDELEHEEPALSASGELDYFDKFENVQKLPKDLGQRVENIRSSLKIAGIQASTLREYFLRQLAGEALSEDHLPRSWARRSPQSSLELKLKLTPQRQRGEGGGGGESEGGAVGGAAALVVVVGTASRMMGSSRNSRRAVLIFLELSEGEFLLAEKSAHGASEASSGDGDSDETAAILLDRAGEVPYWEEPPLHDAPGPRYFVAVSCQLQLQRAQESSSGISGKIVLTPSLPPTLYFTRPNVRITVLSPCCAQPVPQALVEINGARAGTTDDSGVLELTLPPGLHKVYVAAGRLKEGNKVELNADGSERACKASEEQTIEVLGQFRGEAMQDVELKLKGHLFLFLNEMGDEDTWRRGLMLSASCDRLPPGAEPFLGFASGDTTKPSKTLNRHRPYACVKAAPAGLDADPAEAPEESVNSLCNSSLYSIQAKLASLAGGEALEARNQILNSFIGMSSSLLGVCVVAWSTYVKLKQGKLSALETVCFHPSAESLKWAMWLRTQEQCTYVKLFNVPLMMGKLVSFSSPTRNDARSYNDDDHDSASVPSAAPIPAARALATSTAASMAAAAAAAAAAASPSVGRPTSRRGSRAGTPLRRPASATVRKAAAPSPSASSSPACDAPGAAARVLRRSASADRGGGGGRGRPPAHGPSPYLGRGQAIFERAGSLAGSPARALREQRGGGGGGYPGVGAARCAGSCAGLPGGSDVSPGGYANGGCHAAASSAQRPTFRLSSQSNPGSVGRPPSLPVSATTATTTTTTTTTTRPNVPTAATASSGVLGAASLPGQRQRSGRGGRVGWGGGGGQGMGRGGYHGGTGRGGYFYDPHEGEAVRLERSC